MLKLYNTLSRSIEDLKPLNPPNVGMYSCGPTVYDYAHIGNFRTYTAADLLVRVLRFNDYTVKWVMNITDVGHLVSDGDEGEDKMEKGSRKTGKSAWEIAEFYTKVFLNDWKALNLTEPDERPRPTQHIPEQIALVEKLLEKGFAYQIDDGIYFDTSKYEDYGKLAHLDLKNLKEGARIEVNPQKKNPTDFALWKFSYPKGLSREKYISSFDKAQDGSSVQTRQMEWESPWGMGFPGWHIECSAMSMKYLGEQFDIHTGGTDILPVHHVNEVAQSEAATGKHPWVSYWMHGQMMFVEGQKMSKSLGNIYRLQNVIHKGFDPLALRYLYLQTHYRQEMNFTWESLAAAQTALHKLRFVIPHLMRDLSEDAKILKRVQHDKNNTFEDEFMEAVDNDLNMPKALAVVWELIKSDYPAKAKIASLKRMDEALGLDLFNKQEPRSKNQEIPDEVRGLIKEREELRKKGDYKKSDELREKIESIGFELKDTKEGTVINKK